MIRSFAVNFIVYLYVFYLIIIFFALKEAKGLRVVLRSY